jgi:hypothetical protein
MADVNLLPQGLHTELEAILKQYNGDSENDGQTVKLKDDALSSLELYGFVYTTDVHPKRMGCHPQNRGGEGITWARAQTRLSVIKSAGFSLGAIRDNAIGVEDHPLNKHIEAYTLEQCALSNQYAKYVKGEIKYGSIGAGHANHLLSCTTRLHASFQTFPREATCRKTNALRIQASRMPP